MSGERALNFALFVLVLSMPFNGIRPILTIGELSSEGFFYGSLVYLALALPILVAGRQSLMPALVALTQLQSIYVLCIVLFTLLNIETVLSNAYGTRTGPERFTVSLLTYLYYFLISVVIIAHALFVGSERFLGGLSRAFIALGAGLVAICTIEIMSWVSEPARAIITGMRSLFATNPSPALWRLSGLSHEPSFNAFALLACVPWAMLAVKRTRNRRYLLLVASLLLICAASGARTAYAGLVTMGVAALIVRGNLQRLLPMGLDGTLFVLAMFAAGIALPLVGFAMIDPSSSSSDVTRSYLGTAAINAGLENPWGQGFGQASFFAVRQATTLIQYSWELTEFYYGSRHGELPPLFSWYARSFGEFGIVGYALLASGMSVIVARACWLGHHATNRETRTLFFLAIMSLSQFLAIALSIESLRMPQFWLTSIMLALFLLGCRYQNQAGTA